MDLKKYQKKLSAIFKKEKTVKVAYLFGSQASGTANAASDYDFAVFLNSRAIKKNYETKFSLMDKLGRLLGTDKIDIVVLDDTDKPELKYNIIKDGIVIFEKEPYRVLLEPKIMNEFFDFRFSLVKNNLSAK